MEDIVALDIETTGLDPTQDAILEIGCVRFHDHRVVDEWSALIHPGRRIPPFITQLTGITDQMVLQAPSIREVLPELERFTGNAPILGHNVRFDLSFLNKVGILQHNTSVDTYEMASVLLPNAGRYNLGALANILGVPYPATHRALEDARATRGVFLRLFEEVMELPLPILAEILRLSESIDWGGSWPFRMAMRERSKEIVSPASIRHGYQGPIFEERPVRISSPLQPLEELIPLDPEETASVIEPGGVFAQHFPQYEYRSQQVEMLRAVATALSEGQHLMVEAGTGIGKSMAYLIPAAFWAIQNGCRVVISTNTINLQDQLINKDIPDLRKALGIDLQAAVLKGRSNYLCPRRLENFRKHGVETSEDLRVLAKVLVWLQGTQTGDRAEINLNGPIERQIWARLSAEDEGCTSENCVRRTGAISGTSSSPICTYPGCEPRPAFGRSGDRQSGFT
jgi:ATP-dependent DNA helicase DinG